MKTICRRQSYAKVQLVYNAISALICTIQNNQATTTITTICKYEIVQLAINKFGLFETIQVPQAVNCTI